MNMSTSVIPIGMHTCAYCGPNTFHSGMCPRVKSVEYHQDGTTKRVEFHDSRPDWPAEAREAAEHSGGRIGEEQP